MDDPASVSGADPPPPARPGAESRRLQRHLRSLELGRVIAITGSLVTLVGAVGLAVQELVAVGMGVPALAVLLMSGVTAGALVGFIRWQLWPRPLFVIGAVAGAAVFVAHLAGPDWTRRESVLGFAATALVLANLWSAPVWLSREYRWLARFHGDIDATLAAHGRIGQAVEPHEPHEPAADGTDSPDREGDRAASAVPDDVQRPDRTG